MSTEPLDILVLLREVVDPRPPAGTAADGAVLRDRGLRRVANPADLEALAQALRLLGDGAGSVTAVAIGPPRVEDLLRLALSLGAQRAVRVWDSAMEGADAVAEAHLLERVIEILSPELVFSGSRLLDRGDEPAPALAAFQMGRPAVTGAVSVKRKGDRVEVLRKSDRGGRHRVEADLPCVVLFETGFQKVPYPSLEAVLAAEGGEVDTWGIPELGLPVGVLGEGGAQLRRSRYGCPRPNPVRVPTPDATLPGFERVLQLLSGGIQPREGRMHFGSPEEVADGLLHVLVREGLLPGRNT